MFVYVIVCRETLKIYVGQHKYDDLGKYLSRKFWDANHHTSGTRSHLYNAMRKYPRDSWSIHPLVSDIKDKKELDETEQLLIYALNTQNPDVGYNICDGGEGFRGPHSEDTKRKISEHHKGTNYKFLHGHKVSQEEIDKRRQKVIGQKRTPETRNNISSARTGKGMGDRNANHVNGLSAEHKQKIGDSNQKGWSPERRAAWSAYKSLHNGMKGKVPWNKKF